MAIVLKASPSPDLLTCARRPETFSTDAWAKIPASVRFKLIEWARASGLNADQLDRLVNYEKPGSC